MRFRELLCLSTLFALGACVAPPVALTPQLQQNLSSLQVIALIPQSNLDVDVTPGNPGATGLLGALIVSAIDDSRRSKAQQASGGLVAALSDFGFRDRMPRQMEAEFARLSPALLTSPVQLETTDSESQRRILYDTSRANAVLFTSVTYKLVDAKLVVAAHSVMYPKSPNLMAFRPRPNNANPLDEGNAIYRKAFTFRSEMTAPDRIDRTLAEGMANVAWQLASDMGHVAGSANALRTVALPPVGRTASISPARGGALSGSWAGAYRCGRWLGAGTVRNAEGFTVRAELSLKDGKATLVRGDGNYREMLTGEIAADSTLVLRGQGHMNNTPHLPWHTQVMGSFSLPGRERFVGSARLTGTDGLPARDCTLELVQSSS